jgi:hypothetical protein
MKPAAPVTIAFMPDQACGLTTAICKRSYPLNGVEV